MTRLCFPGQLICAGEWDLSTWSQAPLTGRSPGGKETESKEGLTSMGNLPFKSRGLLELELCTRPRTELISPCHGLSVAGVGFPGQPSLPHFLLQAALGTFPPGVPALLLGDGNGATILDRPSPGGQDMSLAWESAPGPPRQATVLATPFPSGLRFSPLKCTPFQVQSLDHSTGRGCHSVMKSHPRRAGAEECTYPSSLWRFSQGNSFSGVPC